MEEKLSINSDDPKLIEAINMLEGMIGYQEQQKAVCEEEEPDEEQKEYVEHFYGGVKDKLGLGDECGYDDKRLAIVSLKETEIQRYKSTLDNLRKFKDKLSTSTEKNVYNLYYFLRFMETCSKGMEHGDSSLERQFDRELIELLEAFCNDGGDSSYDKAFKEWERSYKGIGEKNNSEQDPSHRSRKKKKSSSKKKQNDSDKNYYLYDFHRIMLAHMESLASGYDDILEGFIDKAGGLYSKANIKPKMESLADRAKRQEIAAKVFVYSMRSLFVSTENEVKDKKSTEEKIRAKRKTERAVEAKAKDKLRAKKEKENESAWVGGEKNSHNGSNGKKNRRGSKHKRKRKQKSNSGSNPKMQIASKDTEAANSSTAQKVNLPIDNAKNGAPVVNNGSVASVDKPKGLPKDKAKVESSAKPKPDESQANLDVNGKRSNHHNSSRKSNGSRTHSNDMLSKSFIAGKAATTSKTKGDNDEKHSEIFELDQHQRKRLDEIFHGSFRFEDFEHFVNALGHGAEITKKGGSHALVKLPNLRGGSKVWYVEDTGKADLKPLTIKGTVVMPHKRGKKGNETKLRPGNPQRSYILDCLENAGITPENYPVSEKTKGDGARMTDNPVDNYSTVGPR